MSMYGEMFDTTDNTTREEETMNTDELTDKLYKASRDDGISVRPDGSEPTSGYAVGLKNFELRVSRACNIKGVLSPWVSWVVGLWDRDDVDGEYVLGCWIDGDHVYYDVSRIVQDRQEASGLGRKNGQLAIWDIEAGEEIRLQ